MLEGKNNAFSLPWEIRSIFMPKYFIVSALQHGRRADQADEERGEGWSKTANSDVEDYRCCTWAYAIGLGFCLCAQAQISFAARAITTTSPPPPHISLTIAI